MLSSLQLHNSPWILLNPLKVHMPPCNEKHSWSLHQFGGVLSHDLHEHWHTTVTVSCMQAYSQCWHQLQDMRVGSTGKMIALSIFISTKQPLLLYLDIRNALVDVANVSFSPHTARVGGCVHLNTHRIHMDWPLRAHWTKGWEDSLDKAVLGDTTDNPWCPICPMGGTDSLDKAGVAGGYRRQPMVSHSSHRTIWDGQLGRGCAGGHHGQPMVSLAHGQGMGWDSLKAVYNETRWDSFCPTGQSMAMLALFPGRFGREKRPGNFREFKLYTDITSRQLHVLHSSSEVHMILQEMAARKTNSTDFGIETPSKWSLAQVLLLVRVPILPV